jgi:hypothetical protein
MATRRLTSGERRDFGDNAQNYCESRLDDEPPPTCTCRRRPTARRAGRDFHLMIGFDFHRKIVFNGARAKYDRIDASKPSQRSVRYR